MVLFILIHHNARTRNAFHMAEDSVDQTSEARIVHVQVKATVECMLPGTHAVEYTEQH